MSTSRESSSFAPLRPIRTEADYRHALQEVEALWGAKEGSPEGDRLEVLALLVEDYETRTDPIGQVDPISAIMYWLEQRELDHRALEPILGGRGKVSEVLNRKRRLSLTMIRNLHRELAMPYALLVDDYPLAGEAA